MRQHSNKHSGQLQWDRIQIRTMDSFFLDDTEKVSLESTIPAPAKSAPWTAPVSYTAKSQMTNLESRRQRSGSQVVTFGFFVTVKFLHFSSHHGLNNSNRWNNRTGVKQWCFKVPWLRCRQSRKFSLGLKVLCWTISNSYKLYKCANVAAVVDDGTYSSLRVHFYGGEMCS